MPLIYTKRKFETPEDLQKVVDEYFNNPPNVRYIYSDKEKTNDNPLGRIEIPVYTVTGLALYLNFASRQSIYDYMNNKNQEDMAYIIKRAVLFIESEYEAALRDNNVAGVIFALKNMGWKDKTEVESNHSYTKMPTVKINGVEQTLKLGDD